MDPHSAIDLWGLRRPVEVSRFLAAIREHMERMDEISKAAVSAYADGELVLQLD